MSNRVVCAKGGPSYLFSTWTDNIVGCLVSDAGLVNSTVILIDLANANVVAQIRLTGFCTGVTPILKSNNKRLLLHLCTASVQDGMHYALAFDKLLVADSIQGNPGVSEPFKNIDTPIVTLGSCISQDKNDEVLRLYARFSTALSVRDRESSTCVRARYYWGLVDSSREGMPMFIWDAAILGRWCVASEDIDIFVCESPGENDLSTVVLVDLNQNVLATLANRVVQGAVHCDIRTKRVLTIIMKERPCLYEFDLAKDCLRHICEVAGHDKLVGKLDDERALVIRGSPAQKDRVVECVSLLNGTRERFLDTSGVTDCLSDGNGRVILLNRTGLEIHGATTSCIQLVDPKDE